MRVLIAEDDRDQLAVREMLLRHSGFEPILALDSKTALRKAEAGHPVCAIVDLNFPTEEAGLRLIRELKQFDAGLHIFVLTGENPERLNRFPERLLIDEVINKGAPASKLIRKLKENLDPSQRS
ncbi:MAG: response regulator [Acidobacteriaceae bacterium]|nr:response regulator [Acidobacteriaceae bacterium]